MRTDLRRITMSGRAMGKTTAMAKAAKEIGGFLLCHSRDEALRVNKEHDVRCLYLGQEIEGISLPILVDPHTVSVAAENYERELTALRTENEKLKAENYYCPTHDWVYKPKSQCDRCADENKQLRDKLSAAEAVVSDMRQIATGTLYDGTVVEGRIIEFAEDSLHEFDKRSGE